MGIAAELPGLDDPGFRQGAIGQSLRYGGWRKVVAYVPVGLLHKGENQVDWQTSGTSAMTIRNLRLQVVFGEVSQVANLPKPATAPMVEGSSTSLPSVAERTEKRAQPQLRTGLSSDGGVVGLRKE
jgi:hypothetical protein